MDRSSIPKTRFFDHDEDSKEVNNNSTMDYYNFLVKQPPLEKDQHDDDNSLQVISNSSDQVKFSGYSLGEYNGCDEESNDNEGFKTPTSLEHKISRVLQCPPAPRKPRIAPNLMKRKAPCCRRRIVTPIDVSDEIESVFSIAIVRRHFHGKIKKVRDVNVKSNSDYELLFSGTTS